MTPFLKKLVLTVVAGIATFLVLKFVVNALLDVWWTDAIVSVVVAVLVYRNVSLAALSKLEAEARADLGIK